MSGCRVGVGVGLANNGVFSFPGADFLIFSSSACCRQQFRQKNMENGRGNTLLRLRTRKDGEDDEKRGKQKKAQQNGGTHRFRANLNKDWPDPIENT